MLGALDGDFAKMRELAAPIINKGCNTGDGWLIAAEAADLVEKGYESILIVPPPLAVLSVMCVNGAYTCID